MKGGFALAVSEAKKKATLKWDQAHRGDYWRATIVFPIAEKEAVIEQASAAGLTLSEYIRKLVKDDRKKPCEMGKES